jgi:pimeloyl-ACP methyl ester carboxylesterase
MAAAATALLLAGLLLLGGPALMQDRLLYFPTHVTVTQGAIGGLQPWPDAADFRGWLAPAPAAVRGTALVFHGNAGHAGQRSHLAAALSATGLRVILAEYPGYGPRDGALGEASLVADAAQGIGLAYRQFGAPLLVVGESLGAGVAAAAAARQPAQVAGLMLITPWDRLEHVAAYHYPWLPVKWLLRDRYDSAAHLAAFGRPVVVAVAGQDDIVPARFGQALYEALPPSRRLLLTMHDAGHNDWPARVDAAWWQRAVDFMLSN